MGRVLQPFSYFEPETLNEAGDLISAPNAHLVAGGCQLVRAIRLGRHQPARLVNLSRIQGLDDLTNDENGNLIIGASATLSQIEESGLVRENWHALEDVFQRVIPQQVRNAGTLAGNIAAAVPNYDFPVALTALGAKVCCEKLGTQREIPMKDFYAAPRRTQVEPGEIITSLVLPSVSTGEGSNLKSILKARRHQQDVQKINASVWVKLNETSRVVEDARIVVGGCDYRPLRLNGAEEFIRGLTPDENTIIQLGECAADQIEPLTDHPWIEPVRKSFVQALVHDAATSAHERAVQSIHMQRSI